MAEEKTSLPVVQHLNRPQAIERIRRILNALEDDERCAYDYGNRATEVPLPARFATIIHTGGTTMRRILIALFFLLALSATPLWAGDITGTIVFEGSAPKPIPLSMKADQACTVQHKQPVNSEEVVVNPNGTLKNVFVYVKDGLGGKKFDPPAGKAVLDQKGCVYLPHVLGMQVGQELEFLNSDPCLHTAKASPKVNTPFNLAQPLQGMKLTKKFGNAEIFRLQCAAHNWMNAYIGVFGHPFFAVTGDDGSFRIKGLPPGEYTIEAWQEKYGTRTMAVAVGAADVKTVDFKYKGTK